VAVADGYDLLDQTAGAPAPASGGDGYAALDAAATPPPAGGPSFLNAGLAGLAQGVRDVVQGAATAGGVVYNSAGQLINLGEKGIEGLTGADLANYRIHPAAQNLDALLDAAGLPKGAAEPNFESKLIRSLASVPGSAGLGAVVSAAAPAGSVASTVGQALQAAPVQQAVATAAPDITSLVTDPALTNNPEAKAYVNTIVSLAAAGSVGGLQKWLSAPGLDPVRQALADRARQIYNIPLGATDIAQTPFVRTLASVSHSLPGGGWASHDTDLNDALTRAISNTIGEDATRLTPPVMQAARTRIGNELDRIGAKTQIDYSPDLDNALAQIEQEAHAVTGATPGASSLPPQTAAIQNQLNDVQNRFAANNGQLPGSMFQSMIAKGTPLDMIANNPDTVIANYGQRIRDALFDAWEASAPPGEVQALRDARFQYKNMKTIEPLVEKSATGWLSPKLLTGAARSSFDDMAYSGAGPLGDLGQIGNQFFGAPPDSYTALRSFITGMVANPITGIPALAVAGGGNSMLGSALRSDMARRLASRAPLLSPGPRASLPAVSLLTAGNPQNQ
jgi:hypothetical protein